MVLAMALELKGNDFEKNGILRRGIGVGVEGVTGSDTIVAQRRKKLRILSRLRLSRNSFVLIVRADFWEVDPTKHFSLKKKGFSVKRREGFSE